jgi:hypothetical protein
LLLDDIPSCTLISNFAWQPWESIDPDPVRGSTPRDVEGVCIGFRPGSSGLAEHRTGQLIKRTRVVPTLVHPEDPLGWHDLTEVQGVSLRRARWIDVQLVDSAIHIVAGFQDSATVPTGGRIAVHEYALTANASLDGELLSLTPDPRVLPYRSCSSAVSLTTRLLHTPIAQLRKLVPRVLGTVNGCTHLNDALRSLAEVPVLAKYLMQ